MNKPFPMIRVMQMWSAVIRTAFALVLFICPFVVTHAQSALQAGSQAGKPGARVALVIGNGAYKDSPLLNPTNDAEDMASALQKLGFDVIARHNANQRDMKVAVREFGQKLRGAEAGLFYYAGHGIQVKGINYLVPVAVDIQSEADAEDQTVSLDYVMRTMEESGAKFNIAILDACRNNPFARSFRSATRGLASTQAASGMLIAYATAPGSVAADGDGRNGIYTKYLLKNLTTGDRDILKVFQRVRNGVAGETQGKQMPWESTSMIGEFSVGPQETAPDSSQLELVFWESIKDSHRQQDFDAYIEKFPNGAFQALARDRSLEYGKKKGEPTAPIVTASARSTSGQQDMDRTIVIDPLAIVSAEGNHVKETDGQLSCSEIALEVSSLKKLQLEHVSNVESSQDKTDTTEGATEVSKAIGVPFAGLFGKLINRNNRAKEKASMRELTYVVKRRDHLAALSVMRNCSAVTLTNGAN